MATERAATAPPTGPPYSPTTALLGGLPVKSIDDPITAVFLALFVTAAVCHMTTFQINKRRGKKFVLSGLCFGFCMARIVTCTMRLVWDSHPTNIRVAIAAQIFVQAGVIILFVVNLIFTQRIIRASYPDWAWKKWLSLVFKGYLATIILVLIALITATIQSFYTLDANIRRIDRDIQRFGATYFAVAAFLPLPILLLKLVLPTKGPVEKFGEGRFKSKVAIVVLASVLLTLGAAFRTGTSYIPRQRDNPAWYHSKACFYTFNFAIEFFVVGLFFVTRIDKRFHVPNGSHGPGHYINGVPDPEKSADGSVSQNSPVGHVDLSTEESVLYNSPSALRGLDGKVPN